MQQPALAASRRHSNSTYSGSVATARLHSTVYTRCMLCTGLTTAQLAWHNCLLAVLTP